MILLGSASVMFELDYKTGCPEVDQEARTNPGRRKLADIRVFERVGTDHYGKRSLTGEALQRD